LAAIGIWPDYLFPLLWLSPLFVITSLQRLRGHRTIFAPLAEGNWRHVALLALSALICGFFWELWNVRSFAKWIYTVPFVGRFRVFEMPILGYTGYLPFGLECAVVADWLTGRASPDAREQDVATPAGNGRNAAGIAARKQRARRSASCPVLPLASTHPRNRSQQ
jgi:hypothetical protein